MIRPLRRVMFGGDQENVTSLSAASAEKFSGLPVGTAHVRYIMIHTSTFTILKQELDMHSTPTNLSQV